MPLKWQRGKNPYLHNYFCRLNIGPNVPPPQIVAQAKQLEQKLTAGEKLLLGDQEVDRHALMEASAKLRELSTLAHELLLAHPQPRREDKKHKNLCDELRRVAPPTALGSVLPLLHPMAIFWFTPAPSPEAARLPEWEAFGLTEAGDEEDMALDIVFDS